MFDWCGGFQTIPLRSAVGMFVQWKPSKPRCLVIIDSHIFALKLPKWNLRFLWVFEHLPFISLLAPCTSSCPCCCCWCSCHQRRPSKAWPNQKYQVCFWWTCCESVKELRVETWIEMVKFQWQTSKTHRSHFKGFKRKSVQDTQMPPHHFFLVSQCFGLRAKLQPPYPSLSSNFTKNTMPTYVNMFHLCHPLRFSELCGDVKHTAFGLKVDSRLEFRQRHRNLTTMLKSFSCKFPIHENDQMHRIIRIEIPTWCLRQQNEAMLSQLYISLWWLKTYTWDV